MSPPLYHYWGSSTDQGVSTRDGFPIRTMLEKSFAVIRKRRRRSLGRLRSDRAGIRRARRRGHRRPIHSVAWSRPGDQGEEGGCREAPHNVTTPVPSVGRDVGREPRRETAKALVTSTETRPTQVSRSCSMATERPPGREASASGKRATPGNGNAVPRPLSDMSSLSVRRLDGPERLPPQRGRRQRTHDGDRSDPRSPVKRATSRRARSAKPKTPRPLPGSAAPLGCSGAKGRKRKLCR